MNRYVERGDPVLRDTIFRIASITKPVTGAAAMILVDHGSLALDDSVEPWLPELANRKVLRAHRRRPRRYGSRPAFDQRA
jgi:CubicO group peptidase (beta-lactamase class C family)